MFDSRRSLPQAGNLFDPSRRLQQVFNRIGKAEPQIALAVFAERSAVQASHACLIE
jgi:hypothetical protein